MYILGAIVMVGASAFTFFVPHLFAIVVGIAGIAFFGLCLLLICRMLFERRPIVSFDHEGFCDVRYKVGKIAWTEATRIYICELNGHRWIAVDLKNPHTYVERMNWLRRTQCIYNRRMGFGDFAISLQGLSPGLVEVWREISTWPEVRQILS